MASTDQKIVRNGSDRGRLRKGEGLLREKRKKPQRSADVARMGKRRTHVEERKKKNGLLTKKKERRAIGEDGDGKPH